MNFNISRENLLKQHNNIFLIIRKPIVEMNIILNVHIKRAYPTQVIFEISLFTY